MTRTCSLGSSLTLLTFVLFAPAKPASFWITKYFLKELRSLNIFLYHLPHLWLSISQWIVYCISLHEKRGNVYFPSHCTQKTSTMPGCRSTHNKYLLNEHMDGLMNQWINEHTWIKGCINCSTYVHLCVCLSMCMHLHFNGKSSRWIHFNTLIIISEWYHLGIFYLLKFKFS